MGQRISYFKNSSGIKLKDLIFDNYAAFRKWYLDTAKSSIEEFNEPFGNAELKNYLQQHLDLKTDFDILDKKLIDELTSEFTGTYCDWTDREGVLLKLFGPTISKWRYVNSSEMVLQTKDKDFIRLWEVIIKGRSLKDNAEFDSFTNDYAIGFLTFTECVQLKVYIETYFGDIKQIKNKHAFSHDQKNAGLAYALEVLEEIKEYEIELIIGIDLI